MITEEEKEQALAILGNLMKSMIFKQTKYHVWGSSDENYNPEHQKVAIQAIHIAMINLSDGLVLEEGYKHALLLYPEDMERIHCSGSIE